MDDLQIFLSNKYDFKRKENHGSSFSLLYGMSDGDVKYSILAEYLDKEMPREVVIRAKHHENVHFVKFTIDMIFKMRKDPKLMNAIFDAEIKRLKDKVTI